MISGVHANTPPLAVIDSRRLPVRQVVYWRQDVNELIPEVRITVQQHDVAGRVVAQRDPRFLAPTARPNLAAVYSLSGAVLFSDSIDAGWRLDLPGESGQIQERRDGRCSHWKYEYDKQQRLTAIHEQSQESALRTVERLTYASNTAEYAERNQCGQLIRHDDPAGVVWFKQQALSGGLIRQTRRFLPERSEVHADWPVGEADRDGLLQPGEGYTTDSRYSPLGEVLEQTDAGGHRQQLRVDRAGQLQRIDLALNGQALQPLLKATDYNAEGQLLIQVSGNDAVSSATYEASTGRLKRLTATTLKCERLQDLSYEYDPVGNILRQLDHTQPVTFFANQRVAAENTYTYDSLYQLICATGRETVDAGQSPGLPELIISSPIDPARLLNYTEYYEYDVVGNRTGLRHVSDKNPFRQQLRVDPQSNRALPWNEGDDEPDFPRHFDTNGNLQRLAPGTQPMSWDALNQLQGVTTVRRPTAADDGEWYRYSAGGERVVKFSTQQARAVTHRRVVHYLPGLEVRTTDDDEELQVICVALARGSVRCLHWVKGKPDDIDPDQLRYSVDDHLGSCSLELDKHAGVISHEGYFPFGGTAWWAARSRVDADYKTVRYSGKERDACGLYYYGFRYYAPWLGRWVSPDPAGPIDGLNLYAMVRNNPMRYRDLNGLMLEARDPELSPTSNAIAFWDLTDEQVEKLRASDVVKLADEESKEWIEIYTLGPDPVIFRASSWDEAIELREMGTPQFQQQLTLRSTPHINLGEPRPGTSKTTTVRDDFPTKEEDWLPESKPLGAPINTAFYRSELKAGTLDKRQLDIVKRVIKDFYESGIGENRAHKYKNGLISLDLDKFEDGDLGAHGLWRLILQPIDIKTDKKGKITGDKHPDERNAPPGTLRIEGIFDPHKANKSSSAAQQLKDMKKYR